MAPKRPRQPSASRLTRAVLYGRNGLVRQQSTSGTFPVASRIIEWTNERSHTDAHHALLCFQKRRAPCGSKRLSRKRSAENLWSLWNPAAGFLTLDSPKAVDVYQGSKHEKYAGTCHSKCQQSITKPISSCFDLVFVMCSDGIRSPGHLAHKTTPADR
jgi:hypothetical protein